nr:NADH dehydrogenase subunit 6 [Artheneis intricata]
MNTIMILMTMMSLTFMFLKHPLAMTISIMIQTSLISVWTGMMSSSFWYSYIIFITMMSGMLIVFIYMASVASNEKIKTSMKLLIVILIIPVYNFNEPLFLSLENNSLSLQNLFSHNSLLTIIMVTYLLFTMMTVSKIVYINQGPLRTTN